MKKFLQELINPKKTNSIITLIFMISLLKNKIYKDVTK
jgi:hypothetical protein